MQQKITIQKAGEFFEFTVDPEAVTFEISGLRARFNHSFEVVDAAGELAPGFRTIG